MHIVYDDNCSFDNNKNSIAIFWHMQSIKNESDMSNIVLSCQINYLKYNILLFINIYT